jgi:hypothetical protein
MAIPSNAMNGSVAVAVIAPMTTLTVGMASGNAGQMVSVPVNIASVNGAMPVGFQLDLMFDADLTNPNATAGTVVTAAGATVNQSSLGANAIRIIVSNAMPTNVLADGLALNLGFTISATATSGSKAITVTNLIVSDGAGMPISSASVNGSVAVTATAPMTTLTVGMASGNAGQTVTVPVNIASVNGAMPVGFQLELSYDADLTNPNATAGTVVTAAGATVNQSSIGANAIRVIVSNAVPTNVLADGLALNLAFDISATATAGSKAITVTRVIVSDGAGMAIASAGVNGSVAVSVPIVQSTVTAGTTSSFAGGVASVDFGFTVGMGQAPTGVQVEFSFNADLSIPSAARFMQGMAARAAGASVSGTMLTATTARVIVINPATPTVFMNGSLFNVAFDVSSTATVGAKAITITRVIVTDTNGQALTSSSVNGQVNVQAAPAMTTVTAASFNAAANTSLNLPVTMAVASGAMPTGVQVDLTLDAALSFTNPANPVTLGAAAQAAGAQVFTTVNGQALRVIVLNTMTPTTINSGQLFSIGITVSGAAPSGPQNVTINRVIVSDVNGQPLPSTAVSGAVNVP